MAKDKDNPFRRTPGQIRKTRRQQARNLRGGVRNLATGANAFIDELSGGRSTRAADALRRGADAAGERIRSAGERGLRSVRNLRDQGANRLKAERVVRGNQVREGVENLRNKAEGKVGSAADRANARIRREGQTIRGLGGSTPTGENPKGPRAKTPNVERTVVDRSKPTPRKPLLSRALGGTGRALARVTPGLGTAALAGEIGFRGGEALTEAALGTETGQSVARAVGLGGPRSGITGQDTIDQLNNPDQVVPGGTSGGFFSTDERSLNPGRSVSDLDASSSTAPRPLTTAQQILSGDLSAPEQEQEDPVAGPAETRTEAASNVGATLAPDEDEGPRRLSLRDALAGFKRSDNALGDAARLAARLNLTSSNNQALRQTQEFEETQRQNDFDNAIAYSEAQLDRLEAAGDLADDDRQDIQVENAAFQNQVNNINKQENLSPDERQAQILDAAYVQARKNKYDPRELSTQTLFTEIMRYVQEEQPSGFIQRGLAAAGSGTFNLGDAFDDDAPLISPSTIQNFSISNGGLFYTDDNNRQQPVVDLADLPAPISQALTEMLDAQPR